MKFPFQIYFVMAFIAVTCLLPKADALGVYSCSEGLEELSRIESNLEDPSYRDFSKDLASVVMMKSPLLFSAKHYKILREQFPDVAKVSFESFMRSQGKNITADVKLEISEKIWAGLTPEILRFKDYTQPETLPEDERRPLRVQASKMGLTEQDLIILAQVTSKIENSVVLKEKVLSLIANSLFLVSETGEKVYEIANRKKIFETLSQDQRILYPKSMEVVNLQSGEMNLKRFFETGASSIEKTDLIDLLSLTYPILWGKAHIEALAHVSETNGATPKALKKSLKKLTPRELQSLSAVTWDQIANRFGVFEGTFDKSGKFEPRLLDRFTTNALNLGINIDEYLQSRLLIAAIDKNAEVKAVVIKIIGETYRDSLALRSTLDRGPSANSYDDSPTDILTGLAVGGAPVLAVGDLVYQGINASYNGINSPYWSSPNGHQILMFAAAGAGLPLLAKAGLHVGRKVKQPILKAWDNHLHRKVVKNSKQVAKKYSTGTDEE